MSNNTVDDTLSSINKGNDSSSSSSHPPASSRFVIPLGLGGRFFLAFIVAIIGTWYGATQLRTAYIDEYLTWFWYNDLPSLSGVSRIYIYGGLLMTALLSPYSRPHLGDSPLQAPELFSFTLPKFFSLEGAMKLFASDTWINYTMIHLIRTITLTAFVACIVGIGGIIPPILVGIGMVLLHGIVQGCIGTSHRWYVPVYSCVALMFANGNANLSIDAWMYDKYGSAYPFPPVCSAGAETSASILCSGLARKMILMSGISTLFFGAITKFINGGIAWLDGASLSYYVSSEENGRSVWLKNMMSRHRWISLILSLGSIGLEAGSILAVFMPWTRPLIIVSAAGLHLGIWLTMWPNYFPQTLCYAVGMSWMTIIPNVEHYVYTFKPTESTLFASWISIGIWIFLTMVALLRIEYWPFTGIPMYSMYRDCSYSYRFLRDAVQAQSVAYEHAASGYPNALAWSNLWIILRLKNMDPAVIQERQQRKLHGSNSSVGANGYRPSADNNSLDSSEKEFVNLKTRVTSSRYTHDRHGVYLKQWRRTLHNIAALDMSKKPWGEIEQPCVSRYPAHEWLREMLPSLRQYARHNDWQLPSWVDKTGELQLRVKLRDRYAILASIPWNPNSDPTEENSDSQASAQTTRRRGATAQ